MGIGHLVNRARSTTYGQAGPRKSEGNRRENAIETIEAGYQNYFYNDTKKLKYSTYRGIICRLCHYKSGTNRPGRIGTYTNTIYRHHVYPKEVFPNESLLLDVCGRCHSMIHGNINWLKRINNNSPITKEIALEAIKLVTEHYRIWCKYCGKKITTRNKNCRLKHD